MHRAYKELRKAWHPNISPFSESETNARFDWLKQAYTTLVNNWSRFDPQNPQIPAERVEKLKGQQLQWESQSFWVMFYWNPDWDRLLLDSFERDRADLLVSDLNLATSAIFNVLG